MPFNSPDIETFKSDLDNNIASVLKLKTDSHATIKIQSLLNITIYVLATRFLEGSIKHIIYNCCIMRGDTATQLISLDSELKKFNNPDYSCIRDEVLKHLHFDITAGLTIGKFNNTDISFLNEIVRNRHRNVHSNQDSSSWYSKNLKDITSDFQKEYVGLQNILLFIDSLVWDSVNNNFRV
jgi:hypothetical protein